MLVLVTPMSASDRQPDTSALVLKCPGPTTELSGPVVRTVLALGLKCLSAKMYCCRGVLGHLGTGAKVSRVRAVLGLMCL